MKHKVLVIDPAIMRVSEEMWEDCDFDQVYKWVGATMLDHATGKSEPNGDVACVFVDDMGLHTHKPRWILSWFYPAPLAGAGVMFGANADGHTIDVPYSAAKIQEDIRWQQLVPDWVGGRS